MSEHVLFGIVWAAAVVGMAGAWRVGGYNRGLGDGEEEAMAEPWADFYEEDEEPETVIALFDQAEHELTADPDETQMLEWTAELRAALAEDEPGELEDQRARDALEPGDAWLARMQGRSDDEWEAMA